MDSKQDYIEAEVRKYLVSAMATGFLTLGQVAKGVIEKVYQAEAEWEFIEAERRYEMATCMGIPY